MSPRVAVIGAGISGIAAARALTAADLEVVVIDRGHRLGGRMASRTLRDTGLPYDGRLVDVGASYLTASSDDFAVVVHDWVSRGLARPWTDTFHVASAEGIESSVTGPMRYAAPGGLRSLVEDLAARLPVVAHPREVEDVVRTPAAVAVDGEVFDAVVLAMPGPQASDLVAGDDPVHAALSGQRFDPVLTLVAAYDQRCWGDFDGVFVNDSAALVFVADDGRRRGDGAPVLVAHSGSVLAAAHLDAPMTAAPMLRAAMERAVGATASPAWFDVRRWSLAKPRATVGVTHYFDGAIGVCGDAWGDESRIETAWTSGHALGGAIAAALA